MNITQILKGARGRIKWPINHCIDPPCRRAALAFVADRPAGKKESMAIVARVTLVMQNSRLKFLPHSRDTLCAIRSEHKNSCKASNSINSKTKIDMKHFTHKRFGQNCGAD
jgi:hypothetical protein